MYSNYFQFSSIFELVFIQLGGQSRCRSTNQPTAMRHFGHMVSFPAAAYFGLDLGKAVAWPCELSFSTCCCYDLSSLPPRNKKMRCKTTVRARAFYCRCAHREHCQCACAMRIVARTVASSVPIIWLLRAIAHDEPLGQDG